MTVPGVIVRYFLTYLLLVVVVGQILSRAGMAPNELMFLGIIVGAAQWPCLMYGRKNRHYFSTTDKIHVIAAMTLTDMVFQVVFGNLLMPATAPLLPVFLSFLIVVGLHGALITGLVLFTGRQLRRQGWIDPNNDTA